MTRRCGRLYPVCLLFFVVFMFFNFFATFHLLHSDDASPSVSTPSISSLRTPSTTSTVEPLNVIILPSALSHELSSLRRSTITSTWGTSPLLKIHFLQSLADETAFDLLIRAYTYAFRLRSGLVFFCNDHTFLIPPNLHSRFKALTSTGSRHVYEGRRLTGGHGEVFNSGAAGYFMSSETVALVLSSCSPPSTKWLLNNPSPWLSSCLAEHGVRAAVNGGPEIYHMFPPGRVQMNDFDDWAYKKHPVDSVPISMRVPYEGTVDRASVR